MAILTLSQKFNQWLGPTLLRSIIRFRYALGNGVITDNKLLDTVLLLPIAQRLISLEVHDESQTLIQNWINSGLDFSGGKNNDPATIRLRVLDKYLRSVLVPTESWKDIQRWRFYHPIVKWARMEYLQARYGANVYSIVTSGSAFRKSPQLFSTPVSRKNQGLLFQLINGDDADNDNGPVRIPTSIQVRNSFQMKNWSERKDLDSVFVDMEKIVRDKLGGETIRLRGGSICLPFVEDENTSTSELSLEEILEVSGGLVTQCGPFNALCETADIYQFWTAEYINGLASYLQSRADSYESGETLILDIGAGDGILASNLRDYFKSINKQRAQLKSTSTVSDSHLRIEKILRKKRRRLVTQMNHRSLSSDTSVPASQTIGSRIPTVIATDDRSWNIKEKAEVIRMDVRKTLKIYSNIASDSGPKKQVIVLCSWMPMNEDWSAFFREADVDEYILIGESDNGQCGDNVSISFALIVS